MSLIDSYLGDFIVGEVMHHYGENNYNIKVSHIGLKNKIVYNEHETVQIKNRIPITLYGKNFIGKVIKCTIQYRDKWNRLLCTIEYAGTAPQNKKRKL